MPKHWMTRRELLRGALAAGGGLAGLSLVSPFMDQALASDGSPLESRNFIFCYFSGGWDILLGLDPRDPKKFVTVEPMRVPCAVGSLPDHFVFLAAWCRLQCCSANEHKTKQYVSGIPTKDWILCRFNKGIAGFHCSPLASPGGVLGGMASPG